LPDPAAALSPGIIQAALATDAAIKPSGERQRHETSKFPVMLTNHPRTLEKSGRHQAAVLDTLK
jgi:hypothetical protein